MRLIRGKWPARLLLPRHVFRPTITRAIFARDLFKAGDKTDRAMTRVTTRTRGDCLARAAACSFAFVELSTRGRKNAFPEAVALFGSGVLVASFWTYFFFCAHTCIFLVLIMFRRLAMMIFQPIFHVAKFTQGPT